MRYSQSFIYTNKEAPKDADNVSAKLLFRGGYVDRLAAGIYSFLPLGLRVIEKITTVIREEMNAIGGQEVLLPALQPKELWEETGRWGKMEPPLFTVKDIHDRDLALGSTHEEVITDLVRHRVASYKDLPFMLYQIQNKFRNEIRSTGGLLRVREFLMKDAYSFHEDEKDMKEYYQKGIEAYRKIFKRFNLDVVMVAAHSGSIGGEISNEFMTLSPTGEDKVVMCTKCDWAANVEVSGAVEKCPDCGGNVRTEPAIENGHIFSLKTIYSEKMGAYYTTKDGKRVPIYMGCYGIGIGRLMATIVEVHHDDNGILWPKEATPYDAVLVDLAGDDESERVHRELQKAGVDVLWDDRDVSAGEKFADADLLGFPIRLVISSQTKKQNGVEIKMREEKEGKIVPTEKIQDILKQTLDKHA